MKILGFVLLYARAAYTNNSIVHGVGDACCLRANSTSAYRTIDQSASASKHICAQSYAAGRPPAPSLLVSFIWCHLNCPGYTLTPSSDPNAWASPLLQYILPAVIFSLITPRRLVFEPPRWFADYNLTRIEGLFKALFSFCTAFPIICIDTSVWIFMIMNAPGPFIFSGIYEIVLDYRVVRHLMSADEDRETDSLTAAQYLNKKERTQLMIAILAGNLETEGTPANPQVELYEALRVDRPDGGGFNQAHAEEIEVQLRAMLACQYLFGAAVGAPILLYIGQFVYSIISLHAAEGDKGTARALAFGIWWMNIVYVAAISGCLLASNNPSTAAAIFRRRRALVPMQERMERAGTRPQMEDRVQAWIEACTRLPLAYRARFEPVWMWTRGKCKAAWLRNTVSSFLCSFFPLRALTISETCLGSQKGLLGIASP